MKKTWMYCAPQGPVDEDYLVSIEDGKIKIESRVYPNYHGQEGEWEISKFREDYPYIFETFLTPPDVAEEILRYLNIAK